MKTILRPVILRFDSVPSTNTEAARQAERGAPEGLCVIAREQTRGRGRAGRAWVSPMDAGLYFSIVLRPSVLGARSWPLLTLMAALAVRDAIFETCGLETDIKWPNDIIVEDRKLCGILAETIETGVGRAVIVGIGINLDDRAFPPELKAIATSIAALIGQTPDPESLLQSLVRAIARRYEILQAVDGEAKTTAAWSHHSSYAQGRHVRVALAEETFDGWTRGLEPDGALRVETFTGEIRIVHAGDVTSLRLTDEKGNADCGLRIEKQDALAFLNPQSAIRNPQSNMLLVIDTGNTNTTLGVFDGTRLVTHWRLTTARVRTVDEYGVYARNLFEFAGIDFKAITAVAIASVVPPLNYTLKRMSELYFKHTPLMIDHTTEMGLEILYNPPSDVGADRLVDAVAAIHKYGAPCIVVDFGTATTFNAIDAEGRYLGGVITPGINISSEALFQRAARLPPVEIKRPQTVIGSSTVGSMQSGLYYGFVGLVDGILKRMLEELGAATRVVATGGLAPLIATGTEFIETVDDTLTLEGLRLIYERNSGQ